MLERLKLRDRAPYICAVMLYAAWILAWDFFWNSAPSYNDCLVGKMASAFLTLIGYGTYHFSAGAWAILSPATELKVFFGPGFFSGLIVGLMRVRNWKGILKGLIPAVLFWSFLIPLMLLPQGVWLTLTAIRIFIVTAIPYSIIGAVVGWRLAIWSRAK